MTEQELEQELEARIEQVEKGVAEVRPMRKKDYIEVAVLAVVFFAGIVAGAFCS